MLSSTLTALINFTSCCSGLMMCSIYFDEFATRVESYITVLSLCTFSEQLDSFLNRLDNSRTTHGSRNDTIKY
jgi:hypothetical protein